MFNPSSRMLSLGALRSWGSDINYRADKKVGQS